MTTILFRFGPAAMWLYSLWEMVVCYPVLHEAFAVAGLPAHYALPCFIFGVLAATGQCAFLHFMFRRRLRARGAR